MINSILVLLFTIFLLVAVEGISGFFARVNKVAGSKKRAENKYRWADGTFSKVRTHSDLRGEIWEGREC
jgi:Na+-transporting methylmalonyl-CoA/oxaloacetate decarboxylase gamma subunit